MKVVAIIQARMASTRLPGKVLKPVLGRPLLEFQLERLRRSDSIDQIVIATSINKKDDAIVEFCSNYGVECVRGSEEDVLDRYLVAATHAEAGLIVRITSDCPLIDPVVVNSVVSEYLKHKAVVDYCANTIERTFPRGMDTEVFPLEVLKLAGQEATEKSDREHVTPFIYRQPDRFRLHNLACAHDYAHHRWTVDTPEDFDFVSAVLAELYPTNPTFSMEDTIALLEEEPELAEINSHVIQKGMLD